MTTTHLRISSLATLVAASCLVVACVETEPETSLEAELSDEAEVPTTIDRVELEASEAELSADDLEIVDNGDGTWSYGLLPDFDPELRVRGEILTWRYAGQARYSNNPTQGATRTWIATDEPVRTHREQLEEMTRIDRFGRIWKVEAVDDEAWARAVVPAPEEQEDDELEPRVIDFDAPIGGGLSRLDDDIAPGTPVVWEPMSWDHQSCIPGGWPNGNEGHFWEGDGRSIITSGHTARQKTAVKITVNGSITCSGVILRSDQVLTAAHCVSDDNNNPINFNTVRVVRDDIAASRDVTDIDLAPGYGGGSGSGGGTDFADDWAILELETPWSDAFEDMDLSSASDTTLGDLTNVHNLAFPGFAPECDPVASGTLIHNQEFEPIAGILNNTLRFQIDGVPGHSGSPIYYCPDGDNNVCGGGEQGFVIAVFAGWNTTVNRFVGPKSASFINTAIAFMDD